MEKGMQRRPSETKDRIDETLYVDAYASGKVLEGLALTPEEQDENDFLNKLVSVMKGLSDQEEEQILSWCNHGKLLLVKNVRLLQIEILSGSLNMSGEDFMKHLGMYGFRILIEQSLKELGIVNYPDYDDNWIVVLHPLVHKKISHDQAYLGALCRYVRTRRLALLLERKPDEFDQFWLDAIQELVIFLAPKLFSNLSPQNVWDLLSDGTFKTFEPNEIIFKEKDIADGYYVCLHGSVAVHKREDHFHRTDNNNNINCNEVLHYESPSITPTSNVLTKKLGKRLVELPPGASFGEVGFSTHAQGRAASIVAVGETEILARLEAPYATYSTGSILSGSDEDKEICAYGNSVCFLITTESFDLVYGEKTKQFDAKVDCLKANPAFRHWSLEGMYKLAVRMQRKVVKSKQYITDPERPEIAIITSGLARVYARSMASDSAASSDQQADIEVGILGSNDIFGICALADTQNFATAGGTYDRWAVADSDRCHVFVASVQVVRELLHLDQDTMQIVNERAAARRQWEEVCLAAYRKDQTRIPISAHMMKFAKYSLYYAQTGADKNFNESSTSPNKDSALSPAKAAIMEFETVLRETDKMLDVVSSLEEDGNFPQAEDTLTRVSDMCKETIKKLKATREDKNIVAKTRASHPTNERIRQLKQRITACEEHIIRAQQESFKLQHSASQLQLDIKQAQSESQSKTADSTKKDSPRSRRQARLEALEYAINSTEEQPQYRGTMSPVSSHAAFSDQFDLQDDEEGDRIIQKNAHLINHVEVTPHRKVRRKPKASSMDRRLGFGLDRSLAIQQRSSLLSLEQEKRLGNFGLTSINKASSRGRCAISPRPKNYLNTGTHKQSNPSSPTVLPAKNPSPLILPVQTSAPYDFSNQLQDEHKNEGPQRRPKPPSCTVQRLLLQHHISEHRHIRQIERRFDLYAENRSKRMQCSDTDVKEANITSISSFSSPGNSRTVHF